MKTLRSKFVELISWPLDAVLAIAAIPSALALLAYRRIGSARLPRTTRLLKKIGVFPVRDHYYEPLFNDAHLRKPPSADRYLPGIELHKQAQLEFLGKLIYAPELEQMQLDKHSAEPGRFSLNNGSFESGDAEFLYQFIRAIKPRTVIEIGSGNSTKIAKAALDRNCADGGDKAAHICIEPFEMAWLEELGVQVVRKKVEDCPLDWSRALGPGDLLFIDSSHVIRPQGDVLAEYLEIIPQLKSGVYVHVHDIFTPKDYLRSWLVEEVRFWNEQYLLEALLANSTRYAIVAALNFLRHCAYDDLKRVCPYLSADREPGSFYFRIN
jgi:hypothetical protein